MDADQHAILDAAERVADAGKAVKATKDALEKAERDMTVAKSAHATAESRLSEMEWQLSVAIHRSPQCIAAYLGLSGEERRWAHFLHAMTDEQFVAQCAHARARSAKVALYGDRD